MNHKKIAILVEKEFEDAELIYPYYRMIEAGAQVTVIGTGEKVYHGKHGYPVTADATIGDISPANFDAIIIPGGHAPDKMRIFDKMVEFVAKANEMGKIIAGICHGPQLMISAKVLSGKRATCYKAVRDDVINAGAIFEDSDVVVDGNIITSRKPDDLPAFCREIIRALEL
ncbi:MAG: type 1 glutamine amidotransferase [Actinobacteria bacterium]|nr:type 1 glutamine amidotransferase [Actinomycetota bacterium]